MSTLTTPIDSNSQKAWTVLIYMVADGPSGSQALDEIALREISSIIHGIKARDLDGKGPLDHINVAVQVDLKGLKGTFRYVANPDAKGQWCQFDTLKESDATSPKTLLDYLGWVKDRCPADHYLIVFWGHSSSFLGLFGERPKATGPVVQLKLQQLAPLLPSLRRGESPTRIPQVPRRGEEQNEQPEKAIDIVLFKDCWMSTAEIAFELHGYVEYMIGSQGRVPQVGWPYAEIFRAVAKIAQQDSEKTPVEQVGQGVLQALASFYDFAGNRPGKDEVPFSLINLKDLGSAVFIAQLNALVGQLQAVRKRDEAEQDEFAGALNQLKGAMRAALNSLTKRPGARSDPRSAMFRSTSWQTGSSRHRHGAQSRLATRSRARLAAIQPHRPPRHVRQPEGPQRRGVRSIERRRSSAGEPCRGRRDHESSSKRIRRREPVLLPERRRGAGTSRTRGLSARPDHFH